MVPVRLLHALVAATTCLAVFALEGKPEASPGSQDRRGDVECAPTIRKGDIDIQALVAFVRPLGSEARRQCVTQLYRIVADPQNRFLAEYAARSLEALAQERLIDNAPGLLPPVIACERQTQGQLPMYCNRVLAALTRHPYARSFFAREAGTPPMSAENVARAAADWDEYDRLFGMGHPVFDEWLADRSLRAIRTLASKMIEVLSPFDPHHPALGYLGTVSRASADALRRGSGDRIFSLGMGEVGLGPGFAVPGDWVVAGTPHGIRFMLLRPGIARQSIAQRPDRDILEFPQEVADYHETFPALDLELRFQIVTSRDEIRRMSIAAVKEALTELREANASAVR